MIDPEFYVSFKLAELLKKKGFDEPTDTVWYEHLPRNLSYAEYEINKTAIHLFYPNLDRDPVEHKNSTQKPSYISGEIYSAPTRASVHDWLKIKGIKVNLFINSTEKIEKKVGNCIYHHSKILWKFRVFHNKSEYEDCNNFENYEDAREAALKYVLENLI